MYQAAHIPFNVSFYVTINIPILSFFTVWHEATCLPLRSDLHIGQDRKCFLNLWYFVIVWAFCDFMNLWTVEWGIKEIGTVVKLPQWRVEPETFKKLYILPKVPEITVHWLHLPPTPLFPFTTDPYYLCEIKQICLVLGSLDSQEEYVCEDNQAIMI